MPSLADRSVIVVGATGGLGRPLARLLADEGCRLTLVARDADRVRDLGLPGVALGLDVRKQASAAAIVDAALQAYGGIDGIVHAAGAVAFGSVADLPDEVLIDLFTLDTLAPIRLLRTAMPALRTASSEGRDPFVVHVSAVVAEQPMPGMAAYSAAKAALMAYDAAASRELRRDGIRLLDARPPHTETGLATRPLAGQAPRLPQGLEPEAVAARIVAAIRDGEKDLPSTAF
ncbi:MAG: SDR family NAD(P)-dependent oxidoreductase [Candidatus Nanopelagicales bacterium]